MAENALHLDDASLAVAELRIEDPTVVEGYVRDRPDASLTPVIVAQYELRPPGGRAANPDGPWIWCCHCQEANHWSGFVISNSSGHRYSIGKDCAAAYYGLDFTGAKRTFKDTLARQGLLARLGSIADQREELSRAIEAILHSPDLAAIDAKRREIGRASPNAAFLLEQLVASGGTLQEEVRVRDLAAEQRRAVPPGVNEQPIFTTERRSLGPIAGGAFLLERNDLRVRLVALRNALTAALRLADGDTNRSSTGDLQRVVVQVEAAHTDAIALLGEVGQAPSFFAEPNGRRLERWSEHQRTFGIAWGRAGLTFQERGKAAVTVAALPQVRLPGLPDHNLVRIGRGTAP